MSASPTPWPVLRGTYSESQGMWYPFRKWCKRREMLYISWRNTGRRLGVIREMRADGYGGAEPRQVIGFRIWHFDLVYSRLRYFSHWWSYRFRKRGWVTDRNSSKAA